MDNTFVDRQKGAFTRTFWTFLNQNKAAGCRRVLERIILHPSVGTSCVKEAIGRTSWGPDVLHSIPYCQLAQFSNVFTYAPTIYSIEIMPSDPTSDNTYHFSYTGSALGRRGLFLRMSTYNTVIRRYTRDEVHSERRKNSRMLQTRQVSDALHARQVPRPFRFLKVQEEMVRPDAISKVRVMWSLPTLETYQEHFGSMFKFLGILMEAIDIILLGTICIAAQGNKTGWNVRNPLAINLAHYI